MDSNDQIIGPTVDDCYLTISADRTTITEGDNVQFTVSHVGDCPSSPVVNIYVNDSIVYSGQLFNNSLSYVHFFTEPGEFIVYANTDEFIRPSKSIEITVEEATIELPTSQVSWEINNKNVQSIEINNKEVKSIITSNGQVLYSKEESGLLWQPALNGETGANYVHSYSESNGEAIGKGFVFKNGFDNIDNWELSFEFKHDNIRYTGICFLTDLASGYKGREGSSTALTSWEGSWPGGSAYATSNSGEVGYFDVTVTKIDSTHVRLQSETLNRDTTVEISWLASATKLSLGARHNAASGYGPCRIRNILVKKIDVVDDGELEGAQIELNP